MDNQVRLLPAVIGAAAVLAVLRLGAMAVGAEGFFSGSATASAADAATAAPQSVVPSAAVMSPPPAWTLEGTQAAQGTGPAKADNTKPAGGGAQLGQAQSKGEADVLRGLSDRRSELDARENELTLREQLLAATQKQIDDKIAELKQIQSKLDAMLALRDDAQKAQLTALVKMYENMKPADAAKIFDALDRWILSDVASGMKPVKVGAILAAMDTAKAQELTALLASRLILPTPQNLGASAATLPSVPGSPAPGDQVGGAVPTPQATTPTAAPAG